MATTNKRYNLIITSDSAQAIASIKQVNESLDQLSGRAPAVGANFRRLGGEIDSMGRQSMIAMRALGDASNLAGLDRAITQSIGNAAIMTDTVGDLAGAFTMLNPVMLGVAAVGTALAFAFQKIKEEQERAAAVVQAQIKVYADLRAAISDLDKASGDLARRLQEQFDLNKQQAELLADLVAAGEPYRSMVEERIAADEELTRVSRELNAAYQGLLNLQSTTPVTEEESNALLRQAQIVDELREKLIRLSAARQADVAAMSDAIALQKAMDEENRIAEADLIAKGKLITETRLKEAAAQEEAAKRYASALEQVARAQDNILRGMVEKALTPTAVTSADMDAAKQGTYLNKWDEFRRRVEAVKAGTNPAQFGAEFEKALASLNMPLDQAIEKFKNFSLFANPKNLGLVNWDAVTADIGQQLLALVGKANLMREGFAKAWAGLTADQKRSLRELGIESAGDAKKVLMGAADSGVQGFISQMGDKESVKQLKTAGDTLVKNVQAGVLDKETQKTWLGTMDALIQGAVTQLASKDNIKSLFDAGANMLATIAQGFKGSTALTDAMMAAVNQALQDAIAYLKSNYGGAGTLPGAAVPVPATGVPKFAAGGIGYFAKGGLIRVDTGEGYLFTGRGGGVPRAGNTSVNITYAPQVSLATRAEATAMLESIVNEINRNLDGRRA